MLLFIIQIEPLLSTLFNQLPSISFGVAMELSLPMWMKEDLLLANTICRQFEAMSRAIVNRNRKSAILGLGSWAGRQN